MNDRLEEFRRRMRGPEKVKTNWQFWIGSPTAWLALVISSATAFYTFIYYSDELSVVLPLQFSAYDDKQVIVSLPETLTFINTGTRSIVILGVDWRLEYPSAEFPDVRECRRSSVQPQWNHIQFDQTVVKPSETVIKAIKPNKIKLARRDGTQPTEDNAEPFVVCLDFRMAATDSPILIKQIRTDQVWIKQEPSGGMIADVGPPAFFPRYLIKRNMFWTSVIEH
jgi:hypothetical protein